MGNDLTADTRPTDPLTPEVIAAKRAKVIAELADLERDRDTRLAEVAPELVQDLRRKRDELGRLDAVRPQFDLRTLAELRDEDDWLESAPPPAPVLLSFDRDKPYLRDGSVGLLVAPGATGKTYALAQLAVAIASGSPWLGTYHPTGKGRVCLALAEEPPDEVRRRLWHVTRGLDTYQRAEVKRNLVACGLRGRRVAFLRRTPDRSVGLSEWFATFKDALERSGPWRCVILDPWSRWGGPDAETDANAATLGIEALETLTEVSGKPAVIVAAHTRKASKGSSGPQDASDTRGSSAFVDGARWVANLSKQGAGDLLVLQVTKPNYTVPGPPLVLAKLKGGGLRPATPAEIAEADEAQAGSTSKRAARTQTTTTANGARNGSRYS